jgi:hypothetical protein
LRGVSLLGVDSVMAPATLREPAWSRLARDLDASVLERMSRVIGLADTGCRARHSTGRFADVWSSTSIDEHPPEARRCATTSARTAGCQIRLTAID